MDLSEDVPDWMFGLDAVPLEDTVPEFLQLGSLTPNNTDFFFPVHFSGDEPPTQFSDIFHPLSSTYDGYIVSPVQKRSISNSISIEDAFIPKPLSKEPSKESLPFPFPTGNQEICEGDSGTEIDPTLDYSMTIEPLYPPYIAFSPINDDQDLDDIYIPEKDEESEEFEYKAKRVKMNHTWEQTAMQLNLNISANEMLNYSIPEHWLSANEYYQLLMDMERGIASFPFYDLGFDSHSVTYHPSFIYQTPCPALYFLRCDHLKNGKTMFGFPRIKNVSKEYTWKKQGFTTVVPKSNPCIRYLTANCYLCAKGKNKKNQFAAFAGREPVLRMHAVMKIKDRTRGNTIKYQNDNYIDEGTNH